MGKEDETMDTGGNGPASPTDADHSACQQQLSDLQAELQLAQQNADSFSKTIKDLRDTITSLRDKLSKHGIEGSLEARLKQLGFINGPTADVGPSVIDSRYGSLGSGQ